MNPASDRSTSPVLTTDAAPAVFVSHFKSTNAASFAREESLSWPEFCRLFTTHRVVASKDGVGLFNFCRFSTKHRNDANVIDVSALLLDLDDISESDLRQVIAKLYGHAFAVSSTHRHGEKEGHLRLRVAVQLSRPVLGHEWKRFAAAVGAWLGPCPGLDKCLATQSQSYYLPSCPPEGEARKLARTEQGQPLDVDSMLESAPALSTGAVTAPDGEVAAFVTPDADRRPLTRAELEAFARTAPADVARDARALLDGKAWGRKGFRDEDLKDLAWWLVDKHPWIDPASLNDLFRVSGDAVEAEDDAAVTDDYLESKINYALRKVAGKHAREAAERAEAAAARGYIAKARETRPLRVAQERATRAEADGDQALAADLRAVARGEPVADMRRTVRAIANERGDLDHSSMLKFVAPSCEAAGLKLADVENDVRAAISSGARENADGASHELPDDCGQDWIIKAPGGFFLRSKDDFQGPWQDQTSAKNAARDVLPSEVYARWRTTKGGKNAVPCFLDMDEILHRYGTSPQYQEYSYFAPRSELKGSVFTQRIARVRTDIEPAFNAQIDRWLELLAGEHAEALRDYLATVDRLDRGTCAVLIQGKKGVGKDLFAAGVASLWHSTPTPFRDAVSEFNPGLMRGPVVFANESLSVSKYLGETALDALKKLVTSGAHCAYRVTWTAVPASCGQPRSVSERSAVRRRIC